MKKIINSFLAITFISSFYVSAYAENFYSQGIREKNYDTEAFINCKIVVSPDKTIESGTIIIKDGIIKEVGEKLAIPETAKIIDYKNKTIYAGFIEPYLPFKPKKELPQLNSNTLFTPNKNILEAFTKDKKKLESLHKLGFTSALITSEKGIFRGKNSLISLSEKTNSTIKENITEQIGFDIAEQEETYPDSLMGSIAYIRQTFLNAKWYQKAKTALALNSNQKQIENSPELESLNDNIKGNQPVLIETVDDLDFFRVNTIAKEFNLKPIVKGSGQEYRSLNYIKDLHYPILLPLNFPESLPVENINTAINVSLKELQHWEKAPENPKDLYENKVKFSFSTFNLDKPDKFLTNLRATVERGLPKKQALKALTQDTAEILGVDKLLGTIEKGKLAHLLVTDGDIFDKKTKLLDVWIDGEKFEINKPKENKFSGDWSITLSKDLKTKDPIILSIEEKDNETFKPTLKIGKEKIDLDKVEFVENSFFASFNSKKINMDGYTRVSANILDDTIKGTFILPNQEEITWKLDKKQEVKKEEPKKEEENKNKTVINTNFLPSGVYIRKDKLKQPEFLLIKNAYIWTSAKAGNLSDTDILINKGKISKIGKNLSYPKNTEIIDAKGKQVTAGLIDAHSHTGLSRGINESGMAVTSQVRMSDVLDSTDVAFYNELAGGLTSANILHGSANPIGGQNVIVKLKWGEFPEEMILKNAPSGIKFALGENVKQSNWGDKYINRYPQTRMGVEQIIRDRFLEALEYDKEWTKYNNLSSYEKDKTVPPKVNLQLEPLLEILKGKRLLHCHSYRQDEILMLIRLAEEFGFKIATLQHVLEGYKVADAISKHGAGASTFSDWWGYKFEVYDAIPYNGTLMENQNINVSFNSDSDEQARRLNTEASKAVKYGGLKEEEALKFVTINPAKQLKIDKYTGSIEEGKDADLVIWNGNPLSTLSIVEQTWIDGIKYFDRKEDLKIREEVEKERNSLIQKYLASKNPDSKSEEKTKEFKPAFKKERFTDIGDPE
ncbi:MAG: amidohydrolase family protein [Candidatus Sericytochromatia bacterium]